MYVSLLIILSVDYFVKEVVFPRTGTKIFVTTFGAFFAATLVAYTAEILAGIIVSWLLKYGTLIELNEQLSQLELQAGMIMKSLEKYITLLSEVSSTTGSVITGIKRMAVKHPLVSTADVGHYLIATFKG